MTYYRRRRLGWIDRIRVLAVGAGAGLAAAYLAAIWLEREPLPEPGEPFTAR